METSSVMANVSQVSPTEEAPVVDKKRSDVVEDNGHKSLEAKRISLTDLQKTGLEKAFAEERFLEKGREARLAEYLGLSMVQVSGWFRNQRAKMRKEAFVRGNVEEKKYLPLKPMAIRSLPVEQRSELEKAFAEGQFIGKKRMARITEDLGLSKKQVTTWFKYQRAKMRKKAAAEREVKGEQYPPGKNFMNPFTIGQREELEKASGQDAQLEFPKLKNAVVQEKKKKSVKIRQQEGQVKKVRDDHDQLIPVQESSTETLADANVVKGEAGAGRKDGRCSSRRSLLTTFQAVGLAEAFAKEEYIVGGKLVRLAEDLGMSKKQVNAWFCSKRVLKRKKEETAIRKMVEGVAVWPPPDHHPLPGNVAAADSTSDARGGDLKEQGVSAEGNVSESEFITSLEENIGRVERKVEEVMASIAVPLLSMPLSQQEMLMCLARLNSSPWSFGSKAALLLVFTDQIVISVRGGLAGLFQAEGQPPRDVEFVRKTLVAEHLVKKLGEAWKKLFIGIHTAPHQLKLSVDALATLEKTLHRHYRELCALAPNLALHLASKEAALVFIPNYISKEFIATVISKVDAKVKETVVSTLTSQRT